MTHRPEHTAPFTTRDYVLWNSLSRETRDLARRYFMLHPEEILPPAQREEREAPGVTTVTPEGVKVTERRAPR